MFTRILKGLAVAVLAANVVAVPAYALAKSDDTLIVRSDEVIDDDLYASGSEITIEGTVNGDVFAFASTINIRGTVNGDVITAGSTVNISGTITDDLRAAGSTININGARIGDSVSLAGNDLNIDGTTTIGGGVLAAGSSVTSSATIARGFTGGGDTLRLDGTIGKNVEVSATNLTIESSAVVNGNLEYTSDNDADIRGQIIGQTTKRDGGADFSTSGFARAFTLGYSLWAFAGALVVAAVLNFFFAAALVASRKKFLKNPGRTIAWGTAVLLAGIPAIILLMITIVGIPLALVALAAWGLALYMAKFYTAYLVGAKVLGSVLHRKNAANSTYLSMVVGLVLYYVLRLLPIVGFFVRLGTSVVGIGMILSNLPKRKTKKA